MRRRSPTHPVSTARPATHGRRARRPILLAALAGLSFAWVTAAQAQTLAEAVAAAVDAHPRVTAARNAARSIGFEITGAQSQLNARFGLILDPGYGYVRGRGSDTGGDLGVQAIKPIYDSGRTDNEVARQRSRLAAANQQLELARADVATRVADAYVEVVKQQALLVLAREYVGNIAGLNGRVEEIVKLDRGRGYDLLQTQSRLSQAQLTLSTREGQVQEAQANLSQLVGRPVPAPVEPPTPAPLPNTLEAALAALDMHPSVIAGMAEVEAARRAAAVANAWDKPTVSLRGRVNSPEFPAGDRQWFGGYDVGVVTDWNPFDGGVGAARAAAAGAQIQTAAESAAAARRDLATEVSRHWTQMRSRSARTGSLDQLVEGARRVRAAYWEQFQIGKRSIIDLLNAENETYSSQLSAITERLELLQVRYRLLGTLAELTPFLGLPPIDPVPEPPADAAGAAAASPLNNSPSGLGALPALPRR